MYDRNKNRSAQNVTDVSFFCSDDEDFERYAEMIRPIFLRMRLTDMLKMNTYAKYMKKIMTENRLFVLGGLEMQLHDILWAVHDGKNPGRSEGEEIFKELPVTVGGRGPSDVRFSRTRTRVCARRWL